MEACSIDLERLRKASTQYVVTYSMQGDSAAGIPILYEIFEIIDDRHLLLRWNWLSKKLRLLQQQLFMLLFQIKQHFFRKLMLAFIDIFYFISFKMH